MSRLALGTHYRRLGIAFVLFGLSLSTSSFLIQVPLFTGLGLANFLIGLLLIYVPTERVVSQELVSAFCLSSLVNLNSLLEELGLDSEAVYLPANEETHQPRAFLPLTWSHDSPSTPLKDFEATIFVLNNEDAHRSGLLLVPPGSSLMTLVEQESEIDFYNITLDELEDALKIGLVQALEIAKDVRVNFAGASVLIEVGPLVSEEFCQAQSKVAPNLCSQVGCPLCSAVICATTKVAKRPVSVVKISSMQGRTINIELRLLEEVR